MKRPLKPDELRLWRHVASTVHPLPGRSAPAVPDDLAAPIPRAKSATGAAIKPTPARGAKPVFAPRTGLEVIEPQRKRRIIRERDPIDARLDLHGMDQDRARAALDAFLARTWTEGYRAVLIITGKGVQGDGVLRRRVPEWLADPRLHPVVAGVSEAHRRHGGEGALYVALKRRPRG